MWRLMCRVRFSVYNSLAAIAVCASFQGVSEEDILKWLWHSSESTKGRIEMIKVSDDFTLMIDYAHNAMSLREPVDDIKRISSKAAGMCVRVRRKPCRSCSLI